MLELPERRGEGLCQQTRLHHEKVEAGRFDGTQRIFLDPAAYRRGNLRALSAWGTGNAPRGAAWGKLGKGRRPLISLQLQAQQINRRPPPG
jgi:hypothetical protein